MGDTANQMIPPARSCRYLRLSNYRRPRTRVGRRWLSRANGNDVKLAVLLLHGCDGAAGPLRAAFAGRQAVQNPGSSSDLTIS